MSLKNKQKNEKDSDIWVSCGYCPDGLPSYMAGLKIILDQMKVKEMLTQQLPHLLPHPSQHFPLSCR